MNTHLALRSDVVVTVLDEGAVLLDLETKFFYSANSGAWGIIQMFETGTSPHHVYSQCHDWGADDEELKSAKGVVALLCEEALVEERPASGETIPPADVVWCRPNLEKHQEPLQKIMVSAFDPSIPLAE